MCLAVPGRIVEMEEGGDSMLRRAQVDFAGVRKQISLAFTPEAGVGDWILVHAGFALNTVDEEEAGKVWELIRQMDAAAVAGEE